MSREELAVLGGPPEFAEVLHVGRPNLGDRRRFLERVDEILDRSWYTNNGPVVQEFEAALADAIGVDHVVAVCNATQGLSLVAVALGITGRALVPGFTFVATAHALSWLGIEPGFVDVDPARHTLDPAAAASLVDERTTGIVGVHTWGGACDTDGIGSLAAAHGLRVVYDAAHAFGCTHRGRRIGAEGDAEVFSFHATKYVNAFEGGAVTTQDGDLADRVRRMANFGFTGFDRVDSLGTNAKMAEVSAAMGLTSLEAEPAFAAHNLAIWQAYERGLAGLPGIDLHRFDPDERNSHQYVVARVGAESGLDRDVLVEALHAEGAMVRRYFFPGVHRMGGYLGPDTATLPVTEALSREVLILPTGTAMDEDRVERLCRLIEAVLVGPAAVSAAVVSARTGSSG